MIIVTESKTKVLTKKDITDLGIRNVLLQSSFNYERMQAGGWTLSMLPALKKIYKDDKEGLSAAMTDNTEFINTHPVLVGFLMGMLLSLEENNEDRGLIRGLKIALFGPLAGIGDAILWFTLLPIVAGISASFASQGNVLGPIIFFVVYLALFIARIPITRLGYNLGTKAIGSLQERSQAISKSATILGVTVVGGLIASFVSIDVIAEIAISANNVVSIQSDFFDKIFPNILPFGYTMGMYYLLKNKKVNPTVLILITFGLAILLSLLGIL
ncbi:PTS N-acetylgalactosamine transporter subunit IID [Tissierellaceae bacterium BX21]|jgi:PTS system galactosamine-specific IID component|uniref:PTS N-acetylgalactosamine transporter subunit IID n=1 Tax=Paratissierella segnis TaxID=2763679 RepID=A0A926ERC4_9FIRM|nr:PTS N-acetylgalactosamine transporter subunit IID [Paratissierella segnis]